MADRNFDDIAEHFFTKVVNSRKGRLRKRVIEQDLKQQVPELWHSDGLAVIDIGAGTGQWVLELAKLGHKLIYNDISANMLTMAKQALKQEPQELNIEFSQQSYQAFFKTPRSVDGILCHAVIEWLEKPQDLIAHFAESIKPQGWLSLCFYNPAGKLMRNLVMGNFKSIIVPMPKLPDARSLTPANPSELCQVETWLEQYGFQIQSLSGIRVFSDYANLKRGGLAIESEVEQMELAFCSHPELARLGRYIHIIARKK